MKNMKKIRKKVVLSFVFAVPLAVGFIAPETALAAAGTMGFSGGISEGLRMPTVTERLLDPSLNG
ncbi:MAG: hypothetical protein FWF50_03120, partial [Defluviitaleaceae bacterium]|nr:hypothetical protein [Defluviitaleaceae bacterium]